MVGVIIAISTEAHFTPRQPCVDSRSWIGVSEKTPSRQLANRGNVPSQSKLFREEAMVRLVWHHTGMGVKPPEGKWGKERSVRERRARHLEHPPFGRQVAFARVATGLGWTSLGALAVGASAAGAVAIGALAIRALAVRRARIKHLNIEELEVGRLHVRELVVEQEQTPQSGT